MAFSTTIKMTVMLFFSGLLIALSMNPAKADVRINIGFGYPAYYYDHRPSNVVQHYHTSRPANRHHYQPAKKYYSQPKHYNRSYSSYSAPRHYHASRHHPKHYGNSRSHKHYGHSRGHRSYGHRYYR